MSNVNKPCKYLPLTSQLEGRGCELFNQNKMLKRLMLNNKQKISSDDILNQEFNRFIEKSLISL